MRDNVVFVDFGGGAPSAAAPTSPVSAQSTAANPGNGANTFVEDAVRAQQSVQHMDNATATLTEKTNAMTGSARRLRSAMAELDRAHEQLTSLSAKARAIASSQI